MPAPRQYTEAARHPLLAGVAGALLVLFALALCSLHGPGAAPAGAWPGPPVTGPVAVAGPIAGPVAVGPTSMGPTTAHHPATAQRSPGPAEAEAERAPAAHAGDALPYLCPLNGDGDGRCGRGGPGGVPATLTSSPAPAGDVARPELPSPGLPAAVTAPPGTDDHPLLAPDRHALQILRV
ncbi:hypothetical protein [Allostreptomyces psammosilenae]|uniref:Uncharacterized protein n=1 Tax=Allostreptomyces psammosilenae TaxID=1892865 RepID=A0A852ZLK8_9ACTN|nr:hypothetical protein [Allostreptomyces psammosilenae]NYI03279.1 hypothetical protein [Allostreptomyces psammosilenae]